jgi:two-component system phosphate regulon sensor histidine kinase PhoR
MNRTVITFIVLSLLGLIIIQIGLLRIGQITEMERYDTEVSAVMHNVRADLYKNDALSKKIANLSKDIDKRTIFNNDSLPFRTLKEIDTLLKEQLSMRGIGVDYAFALTDKNKNLILTSENFAPETFKYGRYVARLGTAEKICDCDILLHFHQKNLYRYLFSRLAYLLIPSLLFLIIIIGGFSLLIYTINRQKLLLTVKNDFINNLTHELKTPVFSISLLTKVFKEHLKQNKTEKLEAYLDLLEKENTKLKGHIDKVLELASLENGKYNLQKEPCDFHELINDAVAGFSLKLEAQQGKLQKTFQAMSTKLAIDRTHFKNVIQNLLDNAIKYSKGQPDIQIFTQSDQHKLSIMVSDKGIGIAPEHQRHLFDKFYRVTNGNIHPVKGFGLGLSYVKYIVEAHGGSISVDSKKDEGATFTLEIPF